jgi:hypothetical protein
MLCLCPMHCSRMPWFLEDRSLPIHTAYAFTKFIGRIPPFDVAFLLCLAGPRLSVCPGQTGIRSRFQGTVESRTMGRESGTRVVTSLSASHALPDRPGGEKGFLRVDHVRVKWFSRGRAAQTRERQTDQADQSGSDNQDITGTLRAGVPGKKLGHVAVGPQRSGILPPCPVWPSNGCGVELGPLGNPRSARVR